MTTGNWICPKCRRDYVDKPVLCKCLEPGYNFIPVKRRKPLSPPYHAGVIEQSKEYIITAKDREEALNIISLKHVDTEIKLQMLEGIIKRSYPHTPAPALNAIGGNDTILCCNNIHKDIADRAASTATLATLDVVIVEINKGIESQEGLIGRIKESLRTTAQEDKR
jgi:hypothetical protein